MIDLQQHSIDVILNNQADTGAYVACPTMADYAYCWFRDGAFIAYAMNLVGEHESARRFYDWGARIINERADAIHRALVKNASGEALTADDYLHTRYTLEGREGTDAGWPNFQLDSPGTWLWGLEQYMLATQVASLSVEWAQAAGLAARYLAGLWRLPNYDCWEEFGGQVHPYTLAAVYAGLRTYANLTGDSQFTDVAHAIRGFVLREGVSQGHFVKYVGIEAVDASLLGLATPYGVVAPDDPWMQATVARIEADLRRNNGGVKRYAWDSYYGGGDWLLLTAWLGWYYMQIDQVERARQLLAWVEAQADGRGNMPEQVAVNLLAPAHLTEWERIRGPIATPLLWSHAMYLILRRALAQGGK